MSTPHGQFNVLRAKVRVGILIEGTALVVLAIAGYLVITYGLDSNLRLEWSVRLVLLSLFLVCTGALFTMRLYRPLRVPLSDDEMALAVEREVPQMKQELISAVEFERVLLAGGPTVESRELMSSVVADVQGQIARIPFHRALDRGRVQRFAAMLLGTVVLVGTWGWLDPDRMKIWALRNLGLSMTEEWPRLTNLMLLGLETAESRRHPQGDDLTLLVTAGGVVPEQVFLHYQFTGGDSGVEPLTMIGDAEFTITLPTILQDLELWAEGGDGLTERVAITVVERPRIEDLRVELLFPAYMGREPLELQQVEGDIKIPRGGGVQLRGRSTKPLQRAFVTFDQDRRQEMHVEADGHSFSTRFEPTATGLLVLDVLDEDQLGTGKPPRLYLRITEDQPPLVENRATGIGSLITAIARIPGILRLRDDYGLTALVTEFQISRGDVQDPEAGEAPFVPAEVAVFEELQTGATDHDSKWVLDLLPLNPDPDPISANNQIWPGDQVALRFSARDNFGPGEPHVTYSEILSFRVVTRQKLLEDLARRQMEERRELTQVRDLERAARGELAEILSPTAEDDRAVRARLRIHTLARDQKSLGDRVRGISERYGRILDEMLNNRVFDSPQIRTIREKIVAPLDSMAREDFPSTSLLVEDFATSGEESLRISIVGSYDRILERIEVILLNMQDVESLAAIVETLREVITNEENVMSEVRKLQEAQIQKLLNPGRIKDGKDKKGKDGKEIR